MKKLFEIIDMRRDVIRGLEEYLSVYLGTDMDVYDIGCGSKPFASFLKGRVKNHIGVDIDDGFYDSSHIDLVGSAYDVPAQDGAADAIISSQVIEHLDRPVDAIKEKYRLLKPGGLLFLSFPFLYPMHAEPHDYLRYTEFYINRVLEENNFKIIEKKVIGGFWYCAGLYTGMYLQNFDRGLLKKLMLTKAVIVIVKWLFNMLHHFEGMMFKVFKKDTALSRQRWTANYIYVARKSV